MKSQSQHQINPIGRRKEAGLVQDKDKKVFVAMSGGVDSSVAAALLKKEGYDVTGVFMRPWSPDEIWNKKYGIKNNSDSIIHNPCPWQKDREDAMRVAARIGIPLLTWDFSKEYKKEVTDYMIREYKAGRTPNPDVMCNKHIKFGLFLGRALKEGADFIATGHYVRIRDANNANNIRMMRIKKGERVRNIRMESSQHSHRLLTAKDRNKDQSYFLWTLTQKQLKHCLFPIGDYTKPEVRRMARKFGLPTAEKNDSQGVCFIGPLDMKEFLKNYIKPKPGMIYHTNGELLGTHDGAHYYTIGQRHIGFANRGQTRIERGLSRTKNFKPLYVVSKSVKNNTLTVAEGSDNPALHSKEMVLKNVNIIDKKHSNILQNVRMLTVMARTRYRQPLFKATLVCDDERLMKTRKKNSQKSALKLAQIRVLFAEPQKAVTPGQSAVFYKGNELLGGGVIK